MNKLCILLCLTFGLYGCPASQSRAAHMRTAPQLGEIAEVVKAMHQAPGRTRCDTDVEKCQLQIAEALDAHRDELAASLATRTEQRVPQGKTTLGSMPFYDVTSQKSVSPNVRHLSFEDSWRAISAEFNQYEMATDQDEKRERLLYVYFLVLSIIPNDMRRLSGYSMGHDDDSIAHVRALQADLDRCLASAACEEPEMTAATSFFAQFINETYADYFRKLRTARYVANKRQTMRALSLQVARDTQTFEFHANDDITYQNKTLVVPLQAGDFAGFEGFIQQRLESIWRSPNLRVQIRWVTAAQMPSAYRFEAGEQSGARDYVDLQGRKIVLHPFSNSKALAHEFGHVLGLADRYYTIWRERACTYTTKVDLMDIMSGHETGLPTAAQWEELHTHYVPQATPSQPAEGVASLP